MGSYVLQGETYRIEDFDKLPAFSSFLPGLAGIKGIPLWVYYTNRGQGINSFGIHNKDNAMMEFNPANTAYENTALKGFRTFVKSNGQYFEPFVTLDKNAKRSLLIRKNDITLEEVNHQHKIKIRVKYFVLPNDSIGALVRKVSITNISPVLRQIELIDGLPKIIPYGIQNNMYKVMSNLLKSWTEIKNIDQNVPYYTMRASSDDSAEVTEVEGGYFYVGIREGEVQPVIYDTETIFGYDTSLANPINFLEKPFAEIKNQKQCYYNKVPCGFTPMVLNLSPDSSEEFYSVSGFAGSLEQLNAKVADFCIEGYLVEKEQQAQELVVRLTKDIETHTSMPLFDQYMEQNYLDNFLRGGYPFIFHEGANKAVVHLFSRKHGDPERDYNFFSIAGEYYSQGNGNYRDVNQNRRNDIFFQTGIGDFNIKTFMSLIQIDGYNPLEVRPSTFRVKPEYLNDVDQLIKVNIAQHVEKLQKLTKQSFTPGQVANLIARYQIEVRNGEDTFLEQLLSCCEQNIEAGFGEGYWSDHWDYNMDLVESYLKIYPEKEKELLFEDSTYRYYDSPARVLPRRDKYVITKKKEVRQYGSVVHDEEKQNREGFRKDGTNWLKTISGDLVMTTLMGKMISLSLMKFSSLDAYGMGIEMEGGKPGWNDAMNGLPGIFGSGMPETFELKRLVTFICKKIRGIDKIAVPTEISTFLRNVSETLVKAKEEGWKDFLYWDKVSTLREEFREQVRFTTSGVYQMMDTMELYHIYQRFDEKLEEGINRASTYGDGIVPTYFTFRATDFVEVLDTEGKAEVSPYGLPKAIVKAFEVQPLPTFLEGPAKMLGLLEGEEAKNLYSRVRASELYDKKLKMYKTSASIEHISMENGRIRAFTPGWLERESIFLHMEYKYLLSVLRAGLYEQFYEEIRSGMVVFRDPAEYGRSILENSSFLASSVNPDSNIHGRGYVARLSGSTTEAITMWIEMFIGNEVFTFEEGELKLSFKPRLAGFMFDEVGDCYFTFLSRCKVTYHNPGRLDTFGEASAKITKIVVADTKEVIEASCIRGKLAEDIRNGKVKEIEIYLHETQKEG